MRKTALDAARLEKTLETAADYRRKPDPRAEPVLLMWRALISHTLHEAKRTRCGMPTDGALLARWWIAEHKPVQADRNDWERSFECACEWLDEQATQYRMKLVAEIDQAWMLAYERHVRSYIYVRRAMVLTCAGIPTSIAKQFEMPLVSTKDYEAIADVDHGDEYVMYDRREAQAAA